MAVLILLAALILLGVLTQRYGYDSRDRLRTDDEVRAAAGFRWELDPAARAPRGVVAVARHQRRGGTPVAEAA